VLERGDRVLVSTPGGGGYGAPGQRNPAARRRDRALGYVGRAKGRKG
jgi:N-methylhydantoinase B